MATPIKAFASLGRCSVGVGLYMAGAIDQLKHGEAVAQIERHGNRVKVLGRLEAGFFYLLNETYVVPQEFFCWWRLTARQSTPGELTTAMPLVQNLDVDGCNMLPQIELLPAKRAWLPHQQRSFRWMAHREAVRDLFVCESSTSKPVGLNDLRLEWKMEKAFDLRGGVLCDPVGSGKTATVLGLVQYDSCTDTPGWDFEGSDAARDVFSDSWLAVDATLVVCPDHVHEQWLTEVGRTLPDGCVEATGIRTVGELQAAAPFLRQLASCEKGTSATPHIVVAALSMLQDPEYATLISPANTNLHGWLQGQECWEQGLALDCFVWRRLVIDEVHEAVHVCVPGECPAPCTRANLVKNLRSLKSERRWGLTGTAQEVLRNPSSVQNLAQIFRTDFNLETSSRRFIEHYCRTNQVDLAVRIEERLELINLTSTELLIYKQHERDLLSLGIDGTGDEPISAEDLIAMVPLLKLCSHYNLAEQIQREREQQRQQENEEKMRLEQRKPPLLREGIDAMDPDVLARQMYDSKKQAVDAAAAEVDYYCKSEAELMSAEDTKPLLLEASLTCQFEGDPILWAEPYIRDGEPSVVITRVEPAFAKICDSLKVGDTIVAVQSSPVFAFAKRFLQNRHDLEAAQIAKGPAADAITAELQDLELRRSLAEVFQQELQMHISRGSALHIAWRQTGVAVAHQAAEGRGGIHRRRLASVHSRWQQGLASFRFLSQLWHSLAADDHVMQDCPICFEQFDSASSGIVLRCAHMFCEPCITRGRKILKACPLCRFPLGSKMDMVNVREFSEARKKEKARFAAEKERQALEQKRLQDKCKDNEADYQMKRRTIAQAMKYGSKLHRVTQVLLDILEASSDNRVIVFCQFADLELLIASAFTEYGISHARLSAARNIFEQTSVLEQFQTRSGSQRVLLLSLEQSASGTNLTAANHVLLIHPMAASTPERAGAFEQQAIGRCVRTGQTRPVTVWRFVTADTVEETLTSRLAERRMASQDPTDQRTPAGTGYRAVHSLTAKAKAKSAASARRGSSTARSGSPASTRGASPKASPRRRESSSRRGSAG
eukprot:TRINITY_DN76239_c0_g1_i1.p1 TRINITY_DN76239_c0_g1~~TRINITY_DN76239_c0_g1_i1.p1  ORF type:complete len:1118 (-),score=174.71 TRINITY_DN76239_c0_g1_i1:19-3201(-)